MNISLFYIIEVHIFSKVYLSQLTFLIIDSEVDFKRNLFIFNSICDIIQGTMMKNNNQLWNPIKHLLCGSYWSAKSIFLSNGSKNVDLFWRGSFAVLKIGAWLIALYWNRVPFDLWPPTPPQTTSDPLPREKGFGLGVCGVSRSMRCIVLGYGELYIYAWPLCGHWRGVKRNDDPASVMLSQTSGCKAHLGRSRAEKLEFKFKIWFMNWVRFIRAIYW